jgi:hypothetical protein
MSAAIPPQVTKIFEFIEFSPYRNSIFKKQSASVRRGIGFEPANGRADEFAG